MLTGCVWALALDMICELEMRLETPVPHGLFLHPRGTLGVLVDF
jgi:hypothetical protein